jgi:hypothetical protein
MKAIFQNSFQALIPANKKMTVTMIRIAQSNFFITGFSRLPVAYSLAFITSNQWSADRDSLSIETG